MGITIHLLTDPPRDVPAQEGETLLDNLLAAGVAFPHNCKAGNCGACKCEYLGGDILELPYSEHALSVEERARGLVLACRSQAWGDTTIRALAADEVVLHPSRVMRCRVVALTPLTHDIREVRLEIVAGGPFTVSAGQHAALKLGPGIEARNYSMANGPDERELAFHVRRVPGGQASGYVFELLHVGAEIGVSGPLGTAYLREGHQGPILAVAGGSGMAPVQSIVATALAADPQRRVRIYFGVRDERDVYREAWLGSLARRFPDVAYTVVLSQPRSETRRRRGFVADALAADFARFDGFKAYVAGPPPMVEAVEARLLAAGMAKRDIHADAFYSQVGDRFADA